MQRVEIFSEWIRNDKRSLGLLDRSHQQPATYITIQRSRILEGGYEQLSSLSVKALKGIVRVKFVNEQVHSMVCMLLLMLLIWLSITDHSQLKVITPRVCYEPYLFMCMKFASNLGSYYVSYIAELDGQ